MSANWTRIRAYYPGRCALCGTPYAKDTVIYYSRTEPRHRKTRCAACHERANPPAPQPAPRPRPRPTATPATQHETKPGITGTPSSTTTIGKYTMRPQGGVWRTDFPSLAAILERAQDPTPDCPSNATFLAQHHVMVRTPGNDWLNNYTLDRLLAETRNPPTKPIGDIDRITRHIDSALTVPTRQRRVLRRQAEGDELDPERVTLGLDDAWSRIARVPSPARVIRIACNTGVNCNRRPEELYYRGAAACALADAYERAGYAVEIVAVQYTQHMLVTNQDIAMITTMVKRSTQPLDIPTAALVLAQIAFVRIATHLAEIATAPCKVTSTLGHYASMPADLAKEFDIVLEQNITTEQAAIAEVKRYAEQIKLAPAA